jgi:hypothetical protein
VVNVPEQQHSEHDPAHPERARLYAQAHRMDDAAACTLLVIQREDGWSIHGLGLPGLRLYMSDDSMVTLAKSIVARGRQVGDPGD